MGWAKYEEDNYEALTDRWTAGNLFMIPPIYGESIDSAISEETHCHTVTVRKEKEPRNEANIV